jgi:MFS family permease
MKGGRTLTYACDAGMMIPVILHIRNVVANPNAAVRSGPEPIAPGVNRMPPADPEPLLPEYPRVDFVEHHADPQPRSGSFSSIPIRARSLWGWAVVAGLLSGLLTWAAGEVAWERVKSAQTPKIVPFPTAEDHDRVIRDMASSTAVSFIQQGAILGAVLGLAGGLARRRALAGLIAALVGGGLGAIAAGAAALGLLPVYFKNVDPQANDLTYPLLTHGGIWAAAGAAAGLAFGLGAGGRGRWARCAVGGLLGGALATMVYDLVGAIAFPLDKTSQPVSATMVTRLFAQFAVAVFVAGGAALVAAEAPRRSPPSP